MKKYKNFIPCIFFTVILVFLTILTELVFVTKNVYLNSDTVLKIVEQKEISSKLNLHFKSYYTEKYNTTGIPADVYLNVINEEFINENLNLIIKNNFDFLFSKEENIKDVIDYKNLEHSINGFFEDYAKSMNYEKNDLYEKKVKESISDAKIYISSTLDIMQMSTLKKAGLVNKIRSVLKYLDMFSIIISVIIIVDFIIIILLNIKSIRYVFYWLASSCLISSIVVALPLFYAKYTRYFDKFTIKTDHIFHFVTGYLYKAIDSFLFIQMIAFGFSIILYIIFAITNKTKNA